MDADQNRQERYDLRGRRIGVLLNTSSGSCDLAAERDLLDCLSDHGLAAAQTWCGGGDQVDAALSEARAHDLDVLIVLGGDGTIRAAAEQCDQGGPLLLPLPGGTMNMLPRALYGERPWRDALRDTLDAPSLVPVHGGVAGDHRFFCAALFGGPTRVAEAREAIREGHLQEAVSKGVAAIESALADTLRYRHAAEEGEAETMAVLCPLTSRELANSEQVLEAAALKVESPLSALRLGMNAAIRDWRDDPAVSVARVRELALSADQPIPALLDGESFDLGARIEVRFAARAFTALQPAES